MTATQRMVSADEARQWLEEGSNELVCRLAHTVVELTAQLDAEKARADAAEAKVDLVRALPSYVDDERLAWVDANDLRAALADPEAQS